MTIETQESSTSLQPIKTSFTKVRLPIPDKRQFFYRTLLVLQHQGWANYGPRDHLMRPLTEIQTPTVNQAEDVFLLITDF